MGKGCRLNGALACSKPGSTSNNNNNDNGEFPVQPAGDPRPECSTLSSAQSANPSASFSCVASSGKQETLSCTVNGVTNTFTGKKKKVISWATSSSCSSSSGGSSSGGSNASTSVGSASCNCQAEVANFLNIRVNRILGWSDVGEKICWWRQKLKYMLVKITNILIDRPIVYYIHFSPTLEQSNFTALWNAMHLVHQRTMECTIWIII